jgi:hypothetical protein
MNEADWLNSTDPLPMLDFLRGTASDRKLRLFACGCCRTIWHLLSDDRGRLIVELAERYADRNAQDEELNDWLDMDSSDSPAICSAMSTLVRPHAFDAAIGASDFAAFAASDPRKTMSIRLRPSNRKTPTSF